MSTISGTSIDRRDRPRRHTPAILAVVAGMVCGAATISVAMTRPVDGPPPDAAPASVVSAPWSVADALVPSPRPTAVPPAQLPQRPLAGGLPVAPPSTPPTSAPRSDGSLEPDLALVGSWTVEYTVGPGNGNGANIDGRVIEPGATFDFWRAIGEVSPRTGYRRGAIIVGHRIDPNGALAGGICTVSTALFNAAARAGLDVTARTSHGGYLAKYPLGLDAAVAKGDGSRQTMAFRNDTSAPILIRTIATPGTARVDLYAATAIGRTVELSKPSISHRERARDRHVRTASLRRGEHRRVGDRSDGMTVIVRRVVRDAAGQVLHRDRWVSVYRWLEGTVLVGTG
jgi:VanW like protein